MSDETRANRYTVLAHSEPVRNLLDIKRSEFICYLLRVESEAQARAFIDSKRKQYHDARHVCSAFIIGADRDLQRSNDDGEPAGTAGIPMMQALLARRTNGKEGETTDLSDICAVVVRYFGGIKLGAGGLVRAYTEAVTAALDTAQMTARERLRLGVISISHTEAGRLENDLRAQGYAVLGTNYTASHAEITVGVFDDAQVQTNTENMLAEITAGNSHIEWAGTEWVDLP